MRLLLLLSIAGVLFAQAPPPEAGRPRRTMPAPKNLQVLKVPPSELIHVMQVYSASLGVRCNFCHVQGDFASDENPHKNVARGMIRMAQDINAKLVASAGPGGAAAADHEMADSKAMVTCYTCHRGEQEPQVNPPAASATHGEEHHEPAPEAHPPAPPQ